MESSVISGVSKYVAFITMAALGGLVHSLVAFRGGKTKGWKDFIALSVVSGFAGIMWSLLALSYFPENIYLISFAAGMGGYLSVEGMALLMATVQKRLLNNENNSTKE